MWNSLFIGNDLQITRTKDGSTLTEREAEERTRSLEEQKRTLNLRLVNGKLNRS